MNKVQNFKNDKGNTIPNQFIIETDTSIIFQSYNSVIAEKLAGRIYLDINKWDYSKTTGKYRNLFLRESKTETERKIKNGTYILKDLNK